MKLIVGLGNPGGKYVNNRHNIGFSIVDALVKEFEINRFEESKKGKALYAWINLGKEKIEFFKPQTFMNESGFSVAYALGKHRELKKKDIIVIHDDLDLPFGTWKMHFAKGPKVHGGVNSIEEKLGTTDFWRVRIGVDNREKTSRIPGERYVLQDFTDEEKEKLTPILNKIVLELKEKILHG